MTFLTLLRLQPLLVPAQFFRESSLREQWSLPLRKVVRSDYIGQNNASSPEVVPDNEKN